MRCNSHYRYFTENYLIYVNIISINVYVCVYDLGRQDRCQAAKDALNALVPVTVEVAVPYDLHRYIIGQKGKDVREMMTTFDVNIKSTHFYNFIGSIGR